MKKGQIRIIAGELSGRYIPYVPSRTRPSPAKLRKALFDILGDIDGVIFFDLFAGSGSVGIEAISRGAKQVTFIEIEKTACNLIKKNLDALHIDKDRTCVIRSEAMRWMMSHLPEENEIIFASPPYIADFLPLVLSVFEEKFHELRNNSVAILQYPERLIRESKIIRTPSRIHIVGDDALIFWF